MDNVGIILFHAGSFGGATKRFTNLHYFLLNRNNGLRSYFFVNNSFYEKLKLIMPSSKLENIICIDVPYLDNNLKTPIDKSQKIKKSKKYFATFRTFFKKNFLMKIYYFYYLRKRQKKIFYQIENYRSKYNIKLFAGIFSGVIPLYFYFYKNKRPKILFCNMDSWFDNISANKNEWYLKYNLFNEALSKSDKIDFLSPYILDGVVGKGFIFPTDKISLAPNSFADYSKCKIGDKKKFKVAFASRLHPLKNPFLYLEAIRLILKKYNDIHFYLLGDGQLKQEINDYIIKYDLKKFVSSYFEPNPENIFSETSVFISIQETNNYPSQSVLEAMACQNAIIASDVGDTRMFINKDNGILVKLNCKDISKAIEYLYLDRELTKKLGKNARNFVFKNHNINKSVNYYERLFKDLIHIQ